MFIRDLLAKSFFVLATAGSANASLITISDPAVSSGYIPSYYINKARISPETHIIGVYEARRDHSSGSHPVGTARIHITGAASVPVNLVLSSYEPIQWIVDGSGVSFVQSVLINSYHLSTVVGIDSSVVQSMDLGTYDYGWFSASRSSMVRDVEAMYGAPISTFSGVYRATDFSIILTSVPEPSSITLLLGGLGCVGVALRKSKKRYCNV